MIEVPLPGFSSSSSAADYVRQGVLEEANMPGMEGDSDDEEDDEEREVAVVNNINNAPFSSRLALWLTVRVAVGASGACHSTQHYSCTPT